MNSVEDLDVFKLAHQLALKAYAATKTLPGRNLRPVVGPMAAPEQKKRKIGFLVEDKAAAYGRRWLAHISTFPEFRK